MKKPGRPESTIEEFRLQKQQSTEAADSSIGILQFEFLFLVSWLPHSLTGRSIRLVNLARTPYTPAFLGRSPRANGKRSDDALSAEVGLAYCGPFLPVPGAAV